MEDEIENNELLEEEEELKNDTIEDNSENNIEETEEDKKQEDLINLPEEVDETEDIPEELNNGKHIENNHLKDLVVKLKTIVKNNPRLLNRVENKYDFVVETVNSPSNQKLANLEEDEINELLRRREFLNYLKMHGKIWSCVANLVENNVKDIENYSLSKKGFLPKLSLIENVRQVSLSHNAELKKARREDVEAI